MIRSIDPAGATASDSSREPTVSPVGATMLPDAVAASDVPPRAGAILGADPTVASENAAGDDVSFAMNAGSKELRRGALVGRYVVLSKLGAGGMGVVFAAYDPELDRKVALKLLRPQAESREARTRLVREAQALAKLANPNIVAIHDVGEHAGAVWLAMEHVDGETLAAWLTQRRSWREVLAVLTPVALGLSVAHTAGLVHRDIKPDNIMIGNDGRVRVMDLGLARALGEGRPMEVVAAATKEPAVLAIRVTQAGDVLGTPAYMSPEQFRGGQVDGRGDVFSLCVTLWEGLMGERPFAGDTMVELAANVLSGKVRPVPKDRQARQVPAWLRQVCLRGLATEPERRFASMAALLDALSQGQTRARARKWLAGVGAAAVLGASGFAVQQVERANRIAMCEDAGASIAGVWGEDARVGIREGLVATGANYAPQTANRVMPYLDAQAEAWREQRTRACMMAELEGALDSEHLDRAVWCLEARRMELAALVDELEHADAQVVQKAVSAAAGLPPVSPCTDGQVLAALPSPPPVETRAKADQVRLALSQARALHWAGKYPDGLKEARRALADAEVLGWPPMTAEARQLEGFLLGKTGAYPEAEAASFAAYMEAAKMRSWDVAAAAASDLALTIGYRQARHTEGMAWAGHAEVAVLFAGDPLGLREAVRLNNLAVVQRATGAYAEAKVLHERALSIREKALNIDDPDVAASVNHLASGYLANGEYAEAKALYERALAIRENALGPDHPDVAASLASLALYHETVGSYSEAKTLYGRALTIWEKALGPGHPDVAHALDGLANIYGVLGRYPEANALSERALAIREKALGPDHPDVVWILNTLAAGYEATGAHAEAMALYERSLAINEKALGPDHPSVALALNNLARIHHIRGAYREAKALSGRALAIWEKAKGLNHPDVAVALNTLAAAHEATGAYLEAKALSERALAIREKTLGPDHPDVAYVLLNLALVHQAMGKYPEAMVLSERALSIREGALDPDHPDVAAALAGLSDLMFARGMSAESQPLLERAVAIFNAYDGVQEKENATRFNLARVLVRTGGDRARALAEARKAADGFRALGEGKAKELIEVEAFLAEHGDAP